MVTTEELVSYPNAILNIQIPSFCLPPCPRFLLHFGRRIFQKAVANAGR